MSKLFFIYNNVFNQRDTLTLDSGVVVSGFSVANLGSDKNHSLGDQEVYHCIGLKNDMGKQSNNKCCRVMFCKLQTRGLAKYQAL